MTNMPLHDLLMAKHQQLTPRQIPQPDLAEAGVLLALTDEPAPNVLLTRRAAHLSSHKGEVAFPGGKQDEGDVDVVAAALREAREEIGLPFQTVDVLGTLPAHETVTGFNVTSVIAPDTFNSWSHFMGYNTSCTKVGDKNICFYWFINIAYNTG